MKRAYLVVHLGQDRHVVRSEHPPIRKVCKGRSLLDSSLFSEEECLVISRSVKKKYSATYSSMSWMVAFFCSGYQRRCVVECGEQFAEVTISDFGAVASLESIGSAGKPG